MGCVAALISVAIGLVTALGRCLAPPWARRWLDACIWLTLFAPSFVIASGWVMLLQSGGILQQLFGLPSQSLNWFFSPFGLFLVMGLRYFPVCALRPAAGH